MTRHRIVAAGLLACALALLGSAAWSAIFLPVEGEFSLTATGPGIAAETPAVALAADGRFFVAYQSAAGDLGEIPGTEGVYLLQFDSGDAPIGLTQLLNTVVAGEQREPDIACATDGRTMVVWVEETGGMFRIRTRRFAADGSALSVVEDTLRGPTPSRLSGPRISGDGSGAFVVAWAEEVAPADTDVFAQLVDIGGATLTPVIPVNTLFTAGVQADPSVSMNSSRRFVVAWTDESGADLSLDLTFKGIFARAFAGDGTPLFAEFVVPAAVGGDQTNSAVLLREDGSFVVCWVHDMSPPFLDSERVRGFDDAGVPPFPPADLTVATGTPTAQDRRKPRIAGDAAGNSLVTWETDIPVPPPLPPNDQPQPVFVRRLGLDTVPLKTAIPVSSTPALPLLRIVTDPVVSVQSDGDTVFVWVDASDGGSLFARRYTLRNVNDRDNDDISDDDELAIGSNPDRADTDLDGLNDFIEVGPSLSAPLDTDADGAVDFLEPGSLAGNPSVIKIILTPAQRASLGITSGGPDRYLTLGTSAGRLSYTSTPSNRTPLKTEAEAGTPDPDFFFPQRLLVFTIWGLPVHGQDFILNMDFPQNFDVLDTPMNYRVLSPTSGWKTVHTVDGITDGNSYFSVVLRDGDGFDGDGVPDTRVSHVGGMGYKDTAGPLVIQQKDVIGAGGGGGSGGCFIETLTR